MRTVVKILLLLIGLALWFGGGLVINKSSEARFDWIKPYLREIWTGLLFIFIIYSLFTTNEIMKGIVKLHEHLSGLLGYVIMFLIGGFILASIWWFTGKIFTELQSDKQSSLPAIIVQAPSTGNLKQRANDLADDILVKLYRRGWPQHLKIRQEKLLPIIIIRQLPNDPVEHAKWLTYTSIQFRHEFLERIINIKAEFDKLHLKDQRLDDFIKYEKINEDVNKKSNIGHSIILPSQIEDIADRLRLLSDQINNHSLMPNKFRNNN